MSKKRPDKNWNQETAGDETVENTAPFLGWISFDHFWATCVRGGTPAVKSACIAHLKAINAWEDQSKWIAGVQHFGVPVEK